jgi:hypothetical protein
MYHISPQPRSSSKLHEEFVISTLYDSPGLGDSPQRLRISLSEPAIPSTSVQDARNSLWRYEPEEWFLDMSPDMDALETGLYVNRAKVILPDLIAQSGGIVHGINRIIRPPGETILDEVFRRGLHFTYLTKAWTETGVDAHIRDGKSMTLFAAPDKAWKGMLLCSTYSFSVFTHEAPANSDLSHATLYSKPFPRSCSNGSSPIVVAST